MARICPVCQTNELNDDRTMCRACVLGWRQDVLALAGFTPDIEALAGKQASVTPRDAAGHGNQGHAPLPLSETPFELCRRIRAYAIGTLTLMQHGNAVSERMTTVSLLQALVSLDVDRSMLGPSRADLAHQLRYEADRALLRRETRTFAGWCPACGERVYAPVTAAYHECSCGQLLDLTMLRAGTIQQIRDSSYYGSSDELSKWLCDWGLQVSKRTIQRWAQEGKIMFGESDESGRRTYSIAGILKQLQSR